MNIEKRFFGKTKDNKEVDAYTLSDNGMIVEILTLGGTIRNIILPTPGGARDINLGFDTVAEYETNGGYLGALVGRYANRISNAEFTLNGKTYKLDKNDGPGTLHGGVNAYDKKVWDATVKPDGLYLKLHSPDMENGYPGNLDVEVKYSLENRELKIEYTAKSDADTPVNLTNHAYFNLSGHASGSIENHTIMINADFMTPTDEVFAPTGELLPVDGTPFDLRKPTLIAPGLKSDYPQIVNAGGYDHNFVLSAKPYNDLAQAAVLECDGVRMSCFTTQPAIQLYCGNMLPGDKGKEGAVYGKQTGLCLETQAYPDSVNRPEFPNSVLKKGETYHHVTVYKFDF